MKRVRVLFIRTRNIKGVRKSYQVNRYILIEMKMEWYKQRRLHTELATIVDGNVQMLKRQNKKVKYNNTTYSSSSHLNTLLIPITISLKCFARLVTKFKMSPLKFPMPVMSNILPRNCFSLSM